MSFRLIATSVTVLSASPAFAQMLMDSSSISGSDRTSVSGGFVASEIEYEGESNNSADVERKTLGAALAYGVSSEVDVLAQVGLILESEIDNLDEDGEGFTFGAGVRALAYKSGQTTVTGAALFAYQTEKFDWDAGNVDYEYEVDTYDLHLGGVASHALNPTFAPYAGIDLVVFDDGEGKVTAKGGGRSDSNESDVERDDIFNLKLGANINVAKAVVRPEATLIGETTFGVSAGVTF